MTTDLPDIEDMKEVFDLFDFWDGRDGLIDAVKLGDLLRCCGFNPTNALIYKNGGTKRTGEKQYTMEQFLSIVRQVVKERDTGSFKEFMEAFKSFDREGQGYISLGEARHVLTSMGDRLTDEELEDILQSIDLDVDYEGNIKYEEFIKKVMKGPPEGKPEFTY
ncbi:myosin, essential light chain, adductor muscle-like [Saccostrea echinata]|uniref:myosin, essential light chain, adductor muscle-like n=1 Tax=Saccostrea echinata TaxID=191078 RepID=UPI002A81593B|nr:myosin, essential light chain, adductor muscle-like [Saccostrea echinata]